MKKTILGLVQAFDPYQITNYSVADDTYYTNPIYASGGGGSAIAPTNNSGTSLAPQYDPAPIQQPAIINFNTVSPLTNTAPDPAASLPTANPGPLQTVATDVPTTTTTPGPVTVVKSNSLLFGLLAGAAIIYYESKKKKRGRK
jgi:hypothetical protein